MAETIFVFCLLTGFAYITMISSVLTSWNDTVAPTTSPPLSKFLPISVVIAMRNEAEHIGACLESILSSKKQSKDIDVEIIVVDDHSTDKSREIARSFGDSVQVLVADHTGKKAALTQAIKVAKGDLILCTDADCLVGESWISSLYKAIHHDHSQMVTGPVITEKKDTFLSKWQYLDLLGMAAMTCHGIYRNTYRLANGANMAFRKSAFLKVNGFDQNKDLASGDDVFLIQAIYKAYGGGVRYVKSSDAGVVTKSEASWTALWHQRKRWASKTKAYIEKGVVKTQAFAWLYNVIIIIGLLMGPWTHGISFFCSVILLFIKMVMDYLLLSQLGDFFIWRKPFKVYLPIAFIHFIYIILAGIFALLPRKYKWKDRVSQ